MLTEGKYIYILSLEINTKFKWVRSEMSEKKYFEAEWRGKKPLFLFALKRNKYMASEKTKRKEKYRNETKEKEKSWKWKEAKTFMQFFA